VQVESVAPFAALSSVFDRHQSIDAGYAVDKFYGSLFSGHDFFTGEPLPDLWAHMTAEVAVRDSDAVIHRLSYHLTLVGRIRFRKAHSDVAQ